MLRPRVVSCFSWKVAHFAGRVEDDHFHARHIIKSMGHGPAGIAGSGYQHGYGLLRQTA